MGCPSIFLQVPRPFGHKLCKSFSFSPPPPPGPTPFLFQHLHKDAMHVRLAGCRGACQSPCGPAGGVQGGAAETAPGPAVSQKKAQPSCEHHTAPPHGTQSSISKCGTVQIIALQRVLSALCVFLCFLQTYEPISRSRSAQSQAGDPKKLPPVTPKSLGSTRHLSAAAGTGAVLYQELQHSSCFCYIAQVIYGTLSPSVTVSET